MYSTVMDNQAIENTGDLELQFRTAKPAKAVKTHRDWVIAWRTVYKAMHSIFPHHEGKLDKYNNYITSYFASIHLSIHAKVLNLDKAMKKYVGLVNNVTLNEFSKFCYLKTHHLKGHGTSKSSALPKGSEAEGWFRFKLEKN